MIMMSVALYHCHYHCCIVVSLYAMLYFILQCYIMSYRCNILYCIALYSVISYSLVVSLGIVLYFVILCSVQRYGTASNVHHGSLIVSYSHCIIWYCPAPYCILHHWNVLWWLTSCICFIRLSCICFIHLFVFSVTKQWCSLRLLFLAVH